MSAGRNGGNGSEVVAKICRVCTHKATGFHFGVMSCEGCKGFFRRNVKKNARFICNYEKNCDVTGEKRKNCQACRMAKCEEAGMRRDRIMMTERRKNRRTEEKKARLAAEAAEKAAAAARATVIKHEIPDGSPDGSGIPPSPIVKKEAPESVPLCSSELSQQIANNKIEESCIKQERTDQSPNPIQSHPTNITEQSPSTFNSGLPSDGNIKQENNFHPAQFRREQTTIMQIPQNSHQPMQQIDQFQFNSLNQHQMNQSAFNYQHMINQYIPGYQPPTSPPNPIEDMIPNERHMEQPGPEANLLWNKVWSGPNKNDSLGSPSSPNSGPSLNQKMGQSQFPNRTPVVQTQIEQWNNNLELPVNSFTERARNESLGSPSSPTSVSRNSLSGSSSIDDILQAKKKSIDVEMNHIKDARHASYISRHIRDKRRMEEEDKNVKDRMLPYSILDVDRSHGFTSNWLYSCNSPPHPQVLKEYHQPLTTPNGSLVGSDGKGGMSMHSKNLDSASCGNSCSSSERSKREKYTEFFADLMECGVKEIVSYCKLIPEFSSLGMADQEYLLRSSILELLILKCYFNYQDDQFLNGVNGIWLRREDFMLATKDVSFIDNLMQLMQKMAALQMTEEDVLLLMLVTLFNHDSPGSLAQNREQISISKKYFVSKMMEHMNSKNPTIRQSGTDRGTECLLLLPLLSTLNQSFMDILATLSHSRTVDLGPISTLIYELKPELKENDSSIYMGSRIPHWPYSSSNSSNLQKSKS